MVGLRPAQLRPHEQKKRPRVKARPSPRSALPCRCRPPSLVAITLKKSGTKVTKLKAGKYSITVSDRSSSHNFHLTGPGVNKKTSVGGTGLTQWMVTLQKGKIYRFVCDPHATIMKGSFKTL